MVSIYMVSTKSRRKYVVILMRDYGNNEYGHSILHIVSSEKKARELANKAGRRIKDAEVIVAKTIY